MFHGQIRKCLAKDTECHHRGIEAQFKRICPKKRVKGNVQDIAAADHCQEISTQGYLKYNGSITTVDLLSTAKLEKKHSDMNYEIQRQTKTRSSSRLTLAQIRVF